MGSKPSNQANTKKPSKIDEFESDESFHVVEDKFGYYDSTDSEITELHLGADYSRTRHTSGDDDSLKSRTLTTYTGETDTEEEGRRGGRGAVRNSEEGTTFEEDDLRTQREEEQLRSVRYSSEYTSGTTGCKSCHKRGERGSAISAKKSTHSKKSANESHMNHARKHPCEPPDRDQNYEDNLKRPGCHVYTTYDLVKSVENIPEDECGRNRSSQSSPEVTRSRLPLKPNDMIDNSNYGRYPSDDMKSRHPRRYPYEEPDSGYNKHDINCMCDKCTRRMPKAHSRNCKCSECSRMKKPAYDQRSSCSDKSQRIHLAYQNTAQYPALINEMQNTISQRNKDRIRKTMRQFEMLSRQNKSLDKPIYDGSESRSNNSSRYARSRTPPHKPRSHDTTSRKSFCRSDCSSARQGYAPSQRYRGYPEKNNYAKNRWQMDPRSGEWVPAYGGDYDFVNSYPPLPPTPGPMYHGYEYPKSQMYYAPSHRSSSPMKHSMNKSHNSTNMTRNSNRY